ncbi:neurturin [Nothobranchius furzeri]|uniref:Transcript variant X1 n=1 Tax=Nothobranchius furzeri TaxID=105023 RepID=A0A9D3BUY8_NOTFU|nr:neurturin [Nothobranchius furzeri]XP_015811814.1 neurturin [Nothobranchius furzeri]KAF7222176.1 transcript variant X1 [Nothobranchius furzeri]KAF7222177.1 transcript variant X2 [Nothobranchius furzeri]
MKLWKSATFAFVLCSAALSTLLIRNTATIRQLKLKPKPPYTSSPSSSQSASRLPSSEESRAPPQQAGGLHRKTRSADNNMNSLLSDFSAMFQSFTEGELQHVLGTLTDKKRRRKQSLVDIKTKRTKRDHILKACSRRKRVLTVPELGLGHDSDETIQLHYCRGNCEAHRLTYDLVMDTLFGKSSNKKSRRKKNRSMPCCRPTAFEVISFYGKNEFENIYNVSAKSCGCV